MNRSGFERPMIPCQSGSEWDDETVRYFNIAVEQERSFEAFFKVEAPERFSEEVNEFLGLDLGDVMMVQSSLLVGSAKNPLVKRLLNHIIAVTKIHRHKEFAVVDMSSALLVLFNYDDADLLILMRCVLDLFMSNDKTQAIPNVHVERLDTTEVKLLVQVDKSDQVGDDGNLKSHHPEAQLIAEAIAAYQENVRLYERLNMGDFPDSQEILGITMLGTCPTFYLIPVTRALAECVRSGTQPSDTTSVKKFMIPNLPVNKSETILSRPHRYQMAQCLEAFKGFL